MGEWGSGGRGDDYEFEFEFEFEHEWVVRESCGAYLPRSAQ
jgi:hypothetical protein